MNIQEAIKVIIDMGEHEHFVDEPISKKSVLSIINQIEEPKRVVIPKFVAEWVEYCKKNDLTLLEAFTPISERGVGFARAFKGHVLNCTSWATCNQEVFARAWLDGYEIEQEKLYTVEIPNPCHDGLTALEKVADYIILSQMDEYLLKWKEEPEFQLTESEIRKDFDWAWQWAKPVKEVK